ncbi:MAG: TIM barrel protein [Granulicella sp.]
MTHPTFISRRQLLTGAAATGAIHTLAPSAFAQSAAAQATAQPASPRKLKLSLFSKLFQWTDLKHTAAIARDLGFDALDLTVRRKGHVLPERVATDLPAAVDIVQAVGLQVSMISTDIKDIQSPYAESILATARRLGIHHYRWGGLTYKPGPAIHKQLQDLKPQIRDLAQLNEAHQICGMYHTHSGVNMIGGPIWDLWLLIRDLDPRWIGMNYDIGHATIEGGFGGWETSTQLAGPSMRGIALKDFFWPARKPGQKLSLYEPKWCPIGEGIVDFHVFFALVKASSFDGPVQLHFEYPAFAGAENGDTSLHIPEAQLISMVRKDLTAIHDVLRPLDLI